MQIVKYLSMSILDQGPCICRGTGNLYNVEKNREQPGHHGGRRAVREMARESGPGEVDSLVAV